MMLHPSRAGSITSSTIRSYDPVCARSAPSSPLPARSVTKPFSSSPRFRYALVLGSSSTISIFMGINQSPKVLILAASAARDSSCRVADEGVCKPFCKRHGVDLQNRPHFGDVEGLILKQPPDFIRPNLRHARKRLGEGRERDEQRRGGRDDTRRLQSRGSGDCLNEIGVRDGFGPGDYD